jgi:hypothetical protein
MHVRYIYVFERDADRAAASDFAERVHARSDGVLLCATIVRLGIALPAIDGKRRRGLAVGMCRAVAVALLGDESRISSVLERARNTQPTGRF